MKLPNFLRLNKGDYDEENREVVGKMAESLNPSIEPLYNLANNRISLRDNIACVVKDVTVSVDSSGVPVTSTGIALGTSIQTAIGSDVIFAQNQTSTTVFPTAKPFITFTQNGTTFEIKQIAGLPASNQFLLRIVVWGA